MGSSKRVGRRDTGPDALARLAAAPAAERSPWGVTGMPTWLDTPQGREVWESGGDVDAGNTDAGNTDEGEADGAEGGERGGRQQDGGWDQDWPDDDRDGGADGRAFEVLDDDEWEPPRRRLTMLPPAAIGLVLVGVVACLIAGYSLWRQNDPAAPVVAFESSAGPRPSTQARPPAPADSTAPAGEVVVSVVGLVHRPGLVRLTGTPRVADAIARAGGARDGADLLSLNMAQPVRDGDQILVGRDTGGRGGVKSAVVGASGDAGASATTTPGGSRGTEGLVDLNSADAATLDTLPGVGPVTAAAIIAWRDAHGGFTSVDQLAEVDGIGPARLARLRGQVTVG
ncbi:ComEA family DNA-binding protein [Gordonia shandongensis]|uniref:ComEA family DNA-binding protein n=1 Tax=Gordonia shandongensis TaxID=376351 RepID=UPI00055953F8|nr:ComEA family DNA-binding protein [Gordonia shandongensis]